MTKDAWGAGPWQSEPDELEWLDEETGLECLVKRDEGGAWEGYVGVPEDHMAYGKDGPSVDYLLNVQVHEGLTLTMQRDALWWLGFSCNGPRDFAPATAAGTRKRLQEQADAGDDLAKSLLELDAFERERYGEQRGLVYRDLAFAQEQCRQLARQLLERG